MGLLNWAIRTFGASSPSPGSSERDLLTLLAFIWAMVLTGLLGLGIPALGHVIEARYVDAVVTIATGAFLAGAATAAGSFIGFLFGVPRARGRATSRNAEQRDEPGYLPNTNLEQISDWLTKIMVGVGLVEIRSVVAWFNGIGVAAGPAIWPGTPGELVATAIVVHYVLMGFFQGFLVAYLYLPKAFANAIEVRSAVQPAAHVVATVRDS